MWFSVIKVDDFAQVYALVQGSNAKTTFVNFCQLNHCNNSFFFFFFVAHHNLISPLKAAVEDGRQRRVMGEGGTIRPVLHRIPVRLSGSTSRKERNIDVLCSALCSLSMFYYYIIGMNDTALPCRSVLLLRHACSCFSCRVRCQRSVTSRSFRYDAGLCGFPSLRRV